MTAAPHPRGGSVPPALTDAPELEARLAPHVSLDDAMALEAWAASGAMSLTGDADGPALPPPRGLVEAVERLGRSITSLSRDASQEPSPTRAWARAVEIDPLTFLAERAAIAGLHRRGRISCGGAARLLRSADHRWIAVSLARPSDVESIPAWLGIDPGPDSMWDAVTTAIARRPANEVVAQGVLLALAVATLGERRSADRPAVATARTGEPNRRGRSERPLVIDLSSLWAGPLCGHVLHLAGAEVIKVESRTRADGARSGPRAFFEQLNAGKTMVALDFSSPRDLAVLARLLRAADVVIEASRPRALAQLGLTATALEPERDRVWVTITGHGTVRVDGPTANRVGFGDDAAVAGGCVAVSEHGPVFCADAIADPLAGLTAATAVLAARAEGGSWSLDVALSSVAAWAASGGPMQPTPTGSPARTTGIAAAPMARQSVLTAGDMGSDNAWLEQFDEFERARRHLP